MWIVVFSIYSFICYFHPKKVLLQWLTVTRLLPKKHCKTANKSQKYIVLRFDLIPIIWWIITQNTFSSFLLLKIFKYILTHSFFKHLGQQIYSDIPLSKKKHSLHTVFEGWLQMIATDYIRGRGVVSEKNKNLIT